MQTSRPLRHNKSNGRRGSALLMVLWLTAALSAVGLAVANNVRSETERTETNVDDARSYFIARGALEDAALHMLWGGSYLDSAGRPLYYVNGVPTMELDFPGGHVHVDIIPETSKLNLNGSREEDFWQLLIALGQPDAKARELVAAIADWRKRADPENPSPFDSFYLSQTPSFMPRHASFLENEELLQVKGMTAELYYGSTLGGAADEAAHPGLRDCVSVYGTAGAVDINTAERPTLQAVGLAEVDAATIVKMRAQRPWTDYRELAELAQTLGPGGKRLMIGGLSMYSLRATARLKQPDGKLSDLRRTVGALIKFYFPGNNEKKPVGFDVVRWFDRA